MWTYTDLGLHTKMLFSGSSGSYKLVSLKVFHQQFRWEILCRNDHKGIIPPFCLLLHCWTGVEMFIKPRMPCSHGIQEKLATPVSVWWVLFERHLGLPLLRTSTTLSFSPIWLIQSEAFSSLDLKTWCPKWRSLASSGCLLEMQNFSPTREWSQLGIWNLTRSSVGLCVH